MKKKTLLLISVVAVLIATGCSGMSDLSTSEPEVFIIPTSEPTSVPTPTPEPTLVPTPIPDVVIEPELEPTVEIEIGSISDMESWVLELESRYPQLDVVSFLMVEDAEGFVPQMAAVLLEEQPSQVFNQMMVDLANVLVLFASPEERVSNFISLIMLVYDQNQPYTPDNLYIFGTMICPAMPITCTNHLNSVCRVFPDANQPQYTGDITFFGRDDLESE